MVMSYEIMRLNLQLYQVLFYLILVPPSITFSITPSIVNEGQNATIECKVNAANPTPSIFISDNNGGGIFHVGGKATLQRITRSQAGTYTCMADNGMGWVFAYANLTVYREYHLSQLL